MAGIKLLKKNQMQINFVINELLNPDIKKALFDDYYGGNEIALLLYDPRTVVYGVMEQGKPEPVGVIFFSGVRAYRNCDLYAVVFDKSKRNKHKLSSILEKVKIDLVKRYSINSITANVIGKNEASFHLLEKQGFERVGTMKKAIRSNGKYQDLIAYYLLLGG